MTSLQLTQQLAISERAARVERIYRIWTFANGSSAEIATVLLRWAHFRYDCEAVVQRNAGRTVEMYLADWTHFPTSYVCFPLCASAKCQMPVRFRVEDKLHQIKDGDVWKGSIHISRRCKSSTRNRPSGFTESPTFYLWNHNFVVNMSPKRHFHTDDFMHSFYITFFKHTLPNYVVPFFSRGSTGMQWANPSTKPNFLFSRKFDFLLCLRWNSCFFLVTNCDTNKKNHYCTEQNTSVPGIVRSLYEGRRRNVRSFFVLVLPARPGDTFFARVVLDAQEVNFCSFL